MHLQLLHLLVQICSVLQLDGLNLAHHVLSEVDVAMVHMSSKLLNALFQVNCVRCVELHHSLDDVLLYSDIFGLLDGLLDDPLFALDLDWAALYLVWEQVVHAVLDLVLRLVRCIVLVDRVVLVVVLERNPVSLVVGSITVSTADALHRVLLRLHGLAVVA